MKKNRTNLQRFLMTVVFLMLLVMPASAMDEYGECPKNKGVQHQIENAVLDVEASVEATCTKEGYEAYICNDCREHFYVKTPAKGHTTKHIVVPAGNVGGYSYDQCEDCGQKFNYVKYAPVSSVTLAAETYEYTGRPIMPEVLIRTSDGAVLPAENYTVSYINNTAIGQAGVKITYQGNYVGTSTVSFTIVPKAPVLKSVTKGTCQAKLKWKKVSGVSGYEILYDVDKAFGSPLMVKAKASKSQYTLKKLTGGLKYYFAVRSYVIADGKKIYSAPSAVKNVKVKAKSYGRMTMQEQVIFLINKQRARRNLIPVTPFTALDKAAAKRSKEIAKYFSHTRPNGESCFSALGDYRVPYITAGENIAAGQNSARAVVNAWMNSPGHRENILTPEFRHMSVGYYRTDGGYRYHWTQMFTD